MISLAVVLATGGWATGITATVTSALGGGVGAAMAGTGASAAFQTLVTQASISLANNQGNIGKTLKDLGSSSSILGLVTAAGTAGLTYGFSEALGVSAAGTSVGDYLQRSAVQTGVSTGFSIVTQDQDLGEALLQGAVNIAAGTAGGFGANTIGDLYDVGDIDALTHKVLHAGLGAGLGAASSLLDDPGKGALGGAIGGFFAELVAENLPGSMEPQTRADIARAAGTVIAVAAGQDGNAALLAGTNAVENNLKMHMDCLLGGGKDVEGMVKDAEKFIDITIEDIQNFGEEGRALGESFADVLKVGGPLKEGLEIGGKNIGLGVGLGLNGIDLLRGRGKGKGNARARANPKALKQAPSISPITPGSASTIKPSVASSSVADPVKVAPVAEIKASTAMASGTSKSASKVTASPAKPTGSTNLSALDLAEKVVPKKIVVPEVSVKSSATSSIRSPAASSVKPSTAPVAKPASVADTASTSVPKPASSVKKPSTSYGKSPSRPTCSSSRSPQAPSTAPPASSSSVVHKNSLEYVGDTHLYVIKDAETGIIQKYGESAAGKTKLGQSKRAQSQVTKLERETGRRFESKIVKEHGDKKSVRASETKYIKTHRKVFGKGSLPLNKTNH